MDYLSVKEIAELWGISIRMVNYYLNTGRIQGAIRKSGGWLIPANTPHPADLRKSGQRGQEKIPPRMAKCYMPLISRPCDNGFQNLLLTMNDEEERDIARALHHYFRDEHEEAREISEKYLTSKCPEIRLTALITNTMAMLQTGDAAKCRRNLEMIQRDGQRANDDSWRLYSSITDALISVFFHSEKLDLTPIRPAIGILPPGMQYFAMYAIAHALYIRREYEHAMGIAESALLMAGTRYPIDSIYLNIVLCMICMSLKQDERAEQKFDAAWSIASREGVHPPVCGASRHFAGAGGARAAQAGAGNVQQDCAVGLPLQPRVDENSQPRVDAAGDRRAHTLRVFDCHACREGTQQQGNRRADGRFRQHGEVVHGEHL